MRCSSPCSRSQLCDTTDGRFFSCISYCVARAKQSSVQSLRSQRASHPILPSVPPRSIHLVYNGEMGCRPDCNLSASMHTVIRSTHQQAAPPLQIVLPSQEARPLHMPDPYLGLDKCWQGSAASPKIIPPSQINTVESCAMLRRYLRREVLRRKPLSCRRGKLHKSSGISFPLLGAKKIMRPSIAGALSTL